MVTLISDISNYAITSRCNGRCTMCNIWKTEQITEPHIDQISEFFELNQEFLKNLKFIQLTGGEPFLRKDLPDIVSIVHGIAPKCAIWIPTNGLLPDKIIQTTEQILLKDKKANFGITVSIDGIGEVHDIQRGVEGSYKKAVRTLKLLSLLRKNYDFSLTAGFTLSSFNYKYAPLVQKLSYRYNADFSFRPVNISSHYYKNQEKIENNTYAPQTYLNSVARNMVARKGLLRCLTNLAYIRGAQQFIDGRRTLPCTAAHKSIYIDTLGDVYPCIVMDHKLGNIYQNTIPEILQSSDSVKSREIIKELGCPTCWLECEVYRDIKKDWVNLIKSLFWGFNWFF